MPTDGLTEARTPDGLFGDDGLSAFLTGQPRPVTAVTLIQRAALINNFADGLRDDVALLALSVPLV